MKNAEPHLDDVTIVFNGDVLTDVDLPAVVRAHRESGRDGHPRARRPSPTPPPTASWRSTPPARHALHREARTRARSRPTPSTPASTSSRPRPSRSCRRGRTTRSSAPSSPPSSPRGDLVRGPRASRVLDRHRHPREVPAGPPRHPATAASRSRSTARRAGGGWVHPEAAGRRRGRELEGPFYVGPGCRVAAGARVGPDAVLTAGVDGRRRGRGARLRASGKAARSASSSRVDGALLGARVRVGRNAPRRPRHRPRRGHGRARSLAHALTASQRGRT